MDNRGQTAAVNAMVGVIISLMIAIIIVYQCFIAIPTVGETTTYANSSTANSTFADYTDATVEWDNWSENIGADNIISLGDNVRIQCYDNYAGTDNGIIADNLTLSYTGSVISARVQLKYWFDENFGTGTNRIVVYLCNGSDNTKIYEAENENQSGYATVDNDIKDTITWATSTTYTLYIRAEFEQIVDAAEIAGVYGVMDIDDARLTIRTSDVVVDVQAQTTYNNFKAMAWVGIGLMSLVIIVLAAMTIQSVVKSGTGGGKV